MWEIFLQKGRKKLKISLSLSFQEMTIKWQNTPFPIFVNKVTGLWKFVQKICHCKCTPVLCRHSFINGRDPIPFLPLYHNTLGSFDTNYIIFRNVKILIFFSGLKIEFFWSKLILNFFFENILFLTIIQSSDKNFEELVYWWFLIIFHKLLIDFVWSSLDNFRDIFKYNYLLSKPNYLTSFLIGISYPYN